MKKHSCIKSIFLCLFAIPTHAQTIIPSDNPLKTNLDSMVDACVQKYLTNPQTASISIGIVRNGNTFFYNYGETKAGNGILPTPQTIYEIGSISKTFTGILLAQAVLDKKVGLEDDVRKYLKGEYLNLAYNDTAIRVVHLANHTAGVTRVFSNLWQRPDYDPLNPYAGYTRELLYAGLQDMKMNAAPGRAYAYSNMGVGLQGIILEDVYKAGYFSLITALILKPLQMKNTVAGISGIDTNRIAWPHDQNRKPVPFWDMPALVGVGGLRSTTEDMAKYIIANNKDATKAIALSHEPTFGNGERGMGLNWFIATTRSGHKLYNHAGGTGGSRSSIWCIPALNSGFIILTNSVADRQQLEQDLGEMIIRLSRPPYAT